MTDHEGHIVYTNLPHVDRPARRSTDYTTPADRMAEAAALLLRDPNVMCHALIAALDRASDRRCTHIIINKLNDEASQ